MVTDDERREHWPAFRRIDDAFRRGDLEALRQAHRGEPVRWREAKGPVGVARLEDNGATLVTELRIDRNALVNGLVYGVDGMRVGGTRRVKIAPHLAYGEQGVPGLVPANAVLTAEITVLAAL